jgi:hypothetical protein
LAVTKSNATKHQTQEVQDTSAFARMKRAKKPSVVSNATEYYAINESHSHETQTNE